MGPTRVSFPCRFGLIIWSFILGVYNVPLSALDYEKYHPKEKQEEPKGDGSDKSDPKSK
jgi:hypothetical protein